MSTSEIQYNEYYKYNRLSTFFSKNQKSETIWSEMFLVHDAVWICVNMCEYVAFLALWCMVSYCANELHRTSHTGCMFQTLTQTNLLGTSIPLVPREPSLPGNGLVWEIEKQELLGHTFIYWRNWDLLPKLWFKIKVFVAIVLISTSRSFQIVDCVQGCSGTGLGGGS